MLILWSLSAGYFPEEYPGYTTGEYWIVGVVATILFFASVVGHELSHAAMGNALGERVTKITLFIFGGMAHLSGEPKTAAEEAAFAYKDIEEVMSLSAELVRPVTRLRPLGVGTG